MDRKAASYLALGLLLGALAATVVFAGLSRRSPAEKTLVLKLGHGLDAGHPAHLAMEFMARRLSRYSGGSMKLEIFPSGQLGSETEMMEQVQRGVLSMIKTSATAMESFVPEYAVFGIPYLFDDHRHYWRVLTSPLGAELLARGRPRGLVGLCWYDAGSRSLYTPAGPVLRAADLQGMKIRVQPSRSVMDMIQAMGGAPTPISWGELYTALQQGMVDGAENNPPSYLSSRHYESARHFSLDEHSRIPDLLVAGAVQWDALSPAQREWVSKAALDSQNYQRELWARKTEEALALLREAGVKVYHPHKKSFRQATAGLLEEALRGPLEPWVRRIREQR